jgi:hypothetical protein
MEGGTASNSAYCGIAVSGMAQVTIRGVMLEGNGARSISASPATSGLTIEGGTTTIDGATIRANASHGIAVIGGSPVLTIGGGRTLIDGHGSGNGLYLAGVAPQVSLRNAGIAGNFNGIVVYAIGAFEAGDAAVAGDNSFSNNNVDIYDLRPALAVANGEILNFSRTTLKGVEPSAGTYTGMYTDPGRIQISGANQRITFHALP